MNDTSMITSSENVLGKPNFRSTPNLLTGSRCLLGIFLAVAIGFIPVSPILAYVALTLAILTELTDILDGHLVRREKSAATRGFGGIFDSMADTFAHVGACVALMSIGVVPVWVVLLLLWCDLLTWFLRILATVYKGSYPPVLWSGKIKTISQGAFITLITAELIFSPNIDRLLASNVIIMLSLVLVSLAAFLDYFRHYGNLGERVSIRMALHLRRPRLVFSNLVAPPFASEKYQHAAHGNQAISNRAKNRATE